MTEQHLQVSAAPSWRDYLELCKPRVVALIVFTALIGMLLATPILTFFWPTGYQVVFTFLINFILMAISSAQALLHVVRTRRPDGMVLVVGCLLALPVAAHASRSRPSMAGPMDCS